MVNLNEIILIVESPGKIKKIEKLIGCKCVASKGHIKGLDTCNLDWMYKIRNGEKMDVSYKILKDKKTIVSNLRRECKLFNRNNIYVATDGDREGEAIAFDIMDVLKLNYKTTNRIIFNEISKEAIVKAINNPGRLDINLYNAQQARRIIDILFGYTISPILWNNIEKGLSAGRCQSPSVKLIIDRQKLIQDNNETNKNKLLCTGILSYDLINKLRINVNTDYFSKNGIDSKVFDISEWIRDMAKSEIRMINKRSCLKSEKGKKALKTSTLQHISYNVLKMRPSECMSVAQKLYEEGYITYHRTDSEILSKEFKEDAKKCIIKIYGESYVLNEVKKVKIKLKKDNIDQGAHEAIRPISLDKFPNEGSKEYKLYEIIWKYSLSSLMADAKFNEIEYIFSNKKGEVKWNKIIKEKTFSGHLKLFESTNTDSNESIKRELIKEMNIIKINDTFSFESINIKEQMDTQKKPFTAGSLVKMLEETGIGRPSTYSNIVDKILSKGYVKIGKSDIIEKEFNKWEYFRESDKEISKSKYIQKIGGDNNVYIPNELGINVNSFLEENCGYLIEKTFTQTMEDELDEICNGEKCYKDVIKYFNEKMMSNVSKLMTNQNKNVQHKIKWKKKYFISKDNDVIIGAINSKNGDVLVKYEKGKIIKFVSFPPKTNKDNIDINEAIKMFTFPKYLGKINNKSMFLNINKYGWYIQILGNRNLYISKDREVPSKEIIERLLNKHYST